MSSPYANMNIDQRSDLQNLYPDGDDKFASYTELPSHVSPAYISQPPGPVTYSEILPINNAMDFGSQGLSLSLGTQIQSSVCGAPGHYQHPDFVFNQLGNSEPLSSFQENGEVEDSSNPQGNIMHVYNQPSGYNYTNMIVNSKYAKAAQELLDEVVNVQMALKKPEANIHVDDPKCKDINGKSSDVHASDGGEPTKSEGYSSSEVSSAERQELQDKKTKLLSLLDEVDRRYRQYYHQMQILVSSLDVVAGNGSAKPYTALAKQTISRHFRCLRDAISAQVELIRTKLGDSDSSQGGIPRLRYIDHQLRQQRALQHLGVLRHAWRPQRGLPENSVSVLRAWLFEHFLHPYPNDSEKLNLARQTGLSRNQVANWFINARVRLWKPMVEEMYKEEFGESDTNSRFSPDNESKAPEDSVLQDAVTSLMNKVHKNLKPDNAPDSKTSIKIMKSLEQNTSQVDNNASYFGALMSTNVTHDIAEFSGFSPQVSLALGLQQQRNGNDTVWQQQDRFGNSHMFHDFVV